MHDAWAVLRRRFDRIGMVLSGLCALHCVLTLVLVASFGLGGSLLLRPEIHRGGLAIAVVVGVMAIGLGAVRHRRGAPVLIAAGGLALMALALAVGHGPAEGAATIAGVGLVALAHWRNLLHLAR
jgi:MerC mercury resistance protein